MYGKYIKEMHDKTGIDMRTLMYKWAEADQAIRIEQMQDPWKYNLLSNSLLSSPMQSGSSTEPNQLYQAINRKFLSLIEDPNKEKEDQAAQTEFEDDLTQQMGDEVPSDELDLGDLDADSFDLGSETPEENTETSDETEPTEENTDESEETPEDESDKEKKPESEDSDEDEEPEEVNSVFAGL